MRWIGSIIMITACASATGGGAGGSGGFTVKYAAERATVGKHYEGKPIGDCRYGGGREARWSITGARVDGGELPPGLTIEDGSIKGIPTKAGAWTAHIVFSGVVCAGQSLPDQNADVSITSVTASAK